MYFLSGAYNDGFSDKLQLLKKHFISLISSYYHISYQQILINKTFEHVLGTKEKVSKFHFLFTLNSLLTRILNSNYGFGNRNQSIHVHNRTPRVWTDSAKTTLLAINVKITQMQKSGARTSEHRWLAKHVGSQ